MSLKFLIGLLILCTARRAVAERAIVVDVGAATPFAAAELAAALRVRLAPAGAPVSVRVTSIAGGVRVETHGEVRDVAVGGLSGAAAARLVALAANDLLLDDLATSPFAPPSLVASTARPQPSATVGALGAIAGWDGLLGGVTLDAAFPIGRGIAAFDVSGATLVGGTVQLTTAVIHASGGVRSGWLELRAGATIAPVFVSTGGGDRTVLAGAGASVRARVAVSSGTSLVIAGGADVFATRTQYVIDGMTALMTPRFSPWIAVGMDVTP